MDKVIMKYELKRLLFSKTFVTVLIITFFYAAVNLNTEILQGDSGAAPFSSWSYCLFLCNMNTFLLMLLLLSGRELFSANEKRVWEVTSCTSLPRGKYLFTKYLALMCTYLIAAAGTIIISLLFYKIVFHTAAWQNFIIPVLVIWVPSAFFVFGVSIFTGSRNQVLFSIWIIFVLLGSLINFNGPLFLDVFAKGYVTRMPAVLPVDISGEPVFRLSPDFIWSRVIFLAAGIFFYAVSMKKRLSGSGLYERNYQK